MISRRNFFVATIMMLLLVFMFQFTEVAKETWNEYSENEYNDMKKSAFGVKDAFVNLEGEYVAYLGSREEGGITSVVSQWAIYSKHRLLCYNSIEEISNEKEKPEIIVIDSNFLNYSKDVELLYSFAENGINLIFCNLPDTKQINENDKLKKLLGINTLYNSNIKMTGYHLFGGFLLGGEVIYQAETAEEELLQDMDLEVPWVITRTGTKTYMMMMADIKMQNEFLPAILWRNVVGNGSVFAVNGSYMEDITGLGILEAFDYEMNSYTIYPIVNAQNISIANYSSLASENEEKMNAYYSRNLEDVERDLIWPNLVSVESKNNRKLTFLLTPQFDYDDENQPDSNLLIYYLKMLKERHIEAGISTYRVSDTSLADKLNQDSVFWDKYIPNFSFLSVYAENIEEVYEQQEQSVFQELRTVVTEYDATAPLLSFLAEDSDVTVQRATIDARSHTYLENLRVRSIETALGYSNVLLDMRSIVYPKSQEDSWEKAYDKFSRNVNTYYKKFKKFENTTLSESDERVRRFLALEYTQKKVENKIILDISNLEEEAWFLLRTHGECIDSIDGGTYVEMEKDCYLLQVTEPHLEISLEASIQLYFNE